MFDIRSVEDIEKVAAACRAAGISEITIGGIHMKIGPPPDSPGQKLHPQREQEPEIDHMPLPKLRRGPPEEGEWERHVASLEAGL